VKGQQDGIPAGRLDERIEYAGGNVPADVELRGAALLALSR
jgi:hypothetical protein